MSVPYSDDMYSGDASDDDHEQELLSPADGYFHASSSLTSPAPISDARPGPPSTSVGPQVPIVPNVLVEDPTLQQQDSAKAREALEERLNNEAEQHIAASPPAAASSAHYTPSSSTSHHHRRRSVEDDEEDNEQYQQHAQRQQPNSLHYHPRDSQPAAYNPLRMQPFISPLNQHPSGFDYHRIHPHHPHPVDAPPAYSPSPTSPLTAQTGGYQTFASTSAETMGRPSEQQRLLSREPESMGGMPDNSEPRRWEQFRERFSGSQLRHTVKTILGSLVVLSIVAMILSGFTLSKSHQHREPSKDPQARPPKPPYRGPDDFDWVGSDFCLDSPITFPKKTVPLSFGKDRIMNIVQGTVPSEPGNATPYIDGEIILRPTRDGESARMDVEYITNREDMGLEFNFKERERSLEILTPRRVYWSDTQKGGPCIRIKVTIWAPKQANLETMLISTVHLGIHLASDLDLNVHERVELQALGGNVTTPVQSTNQFRNGIQPYQLQTRSILVETGSGDICGWFPLYDLLKLSTISGDVDVDVDPRPEDPDRPAPAILDVKSLSGNVAMSQHFAKFPSPVSQDRSLPQRDYRSTIATTSGEIRAEVAFGSLGRFESKSGDLRLRLLPAFDPAMPLYGGEPPMLATDTKSGETELLVMDPVWVRLNHLENLAPPAELPKIPCLARAERNCWDLTEGNKNSEGRDVKQTAASPIFTRLASKHVSISGDIRLQYPSIWEGNVLCESISGHMRLAGEGLVVTRPTGVVKNRVQAHKGDGQSQLVVMTTSGNQDVLIGQRK